jgi:hypothetical protein
VIGTPDRPGGAPESKVFRDYITVAVQIGPEEAVRAARVLPVFYGVIPSVYEMDKCLLGIGDNARIVQVPRARELGIKIGVGRERVDAEHIRFEKQQVGLIRYPCAHRFLPLVRENAQPIVMRLAQ